MLIKGPAILAFLGPALVIAADKYRWRRYAIFLGGMILLVVAGKMGLSQRQMPAMILGGAGGLAVAYCMCRLLIPLLRLPVGAVWGVPLMFAVCGWWFVYVSVTSTAHEESARRFIVFEVLTRITQPMESHWGPPGYYLAVLAGGLLPFTAAIVPLAAWSRQNLRQDNTRSLLWAWAIGSWALCEIASTKLPHYILPAVPALAVLAAMWWRQANDLDTPINRRRAFGLVLPVLLFAFVIGTFACIAWQEGLRIWLVDQLLDEKPDIAARIAYLAKLQTWQINHLLAALVILLLTSAAGFVAARRYGLRRGLLVQACGWSVGLLILMIAMTSRTPFNESLSRQAARQGLEMGGEEMRYFVIGYTEPAVFFYLPADGYTRVDSTRRLPELTALREPFVLISSRKLEQNIRRRFGPRIAESSVVFGLNTAKGAPETACVYRIVPDSQVTTPASSLSSQPANGKRNGGHAPGKE